MLTEYSSVNKINKNHLDLILLKKQTITRAISREVNLFLKDKIESELYDLTELTIMQDGVCIDFISKVISDVDSLECFQGLDLESKVVVVITELVFLS